MINIVQQSIVVKLLFKSIMPQNGIYWTVVRGGRGWKVLSSILYFDNSKYSYSKNYFIFLKVNKLPTLEGLLIVSFWDGVNNWLINTVNHTIWISKNYKNNPDYRKKSVTFEDIQLWLWSLWSMTSEQIFFIVYDLYKTFIVIKWETVFMK